MGFPKFFGRLFKSAKTTYPAVVDPSKVRTVVRTTGIVSPEQMAKTYYGLNENLYDILQIPEPVGAIYSGIPIQPSAKSMQFVQDVLEAVKMAQSRGALQEPKNEIFDTSILKRLKAGAEHTVYEHPTDPNRVLKTAHGLQWGDPEGALSIGVDYAKRHNPLYNMRLNVEGVGKTDYGAWFPVFSQGKLQVIPETVNTPEEAQNMRDAIDRFAKRIGTDPVYRWNMKLPMNSIFSENSDVIPLGGKDFKPSNIGFTKDGFLMGYDLHKSGGTIKSIF